MAPTVTVSYNVRNLSQLKGNEGNRTFPLDERTTAASIKQLVADITGITANHLVIKAYSGEWTGYTTKGHFTEVPSCTTLSDNELILPVVTRVPAHRNVRFKNTGRKPSLSISAQKCADPAHCPTVVKVAAISGRPRMLGTFPFDKSTTGGALKARISAKEGIDVGSHRFIFGGGKELRDGATLVGQGIIDGQMIVVLKARKSTK